MSQALVFLQTEGDAWLARNRERLGLHDPVSDVMDKFAIQPTKVLEIGCSNGWRLHKLASRYNCQVHGIDPSADAVCESKIVQRGTADTLPFVSRQFDLVIFGFCLYVCDPADLLRIAAEADRVLQDGGDLLIHDFAHEGPPFRRVYRDRADLFAFHMSFAALWLAHPAYWLLTRQIIGDESVTVLRKSASFPLQHSYRVVHP